MGNIYDNYHSGDCDGFRFPGRSFNYRVIKNKIIASMILYRPSAIVNKIDFTADGWYNELS
jgi:hypothetical protein